jgi:hypothetical protein
MPGPMDWQRQVARHDDRLPSADLAALWAITHFVGWDPHKDDYLTGFVSTPQLVAEARVSDKTCKRAIAWARRRDLLEVTRGTYGRANTYRLRFGPPEIEYTAPLAIEAPAAGPQPGFLDPDYGPQPGFLDPDYGVASANGDRPDRNRGSSTPIGDDPNRGSSTPIGPDEDEWPWLPVIGVPRPLPIGVPRPRPRPLPS